MNTVYFQTKNIKSKYCEIGMISKTDPEYIWYLNEACKILISEVKIIPKEKVIYNKKQKLYISMEWISITEELPKYDPNDQPAFDIFIKATNKRYYSGYAVTEYDKTTFYQHNGRKILNVTHWMYIPE